MESQVEGRIVVRCAACGRVFSLSPAQYKLMKNTIITCSEDCAVKMLPIEEDR